MNSLYHSHISKKLYLSVFGLFYAFVVSAQQVPADTLQMEEVEVVATRIQQPLTYQPTHVEIIDSVRLGLMQGQNIGQVLASESSLFIKDNGPGGFSAASQRGLSSEQIQVLWEGIPINNVMLGLADLSLLPARYFSDVQVSSGTPSSAFGGGSLSGALYLSSDWDGKNQLSLQQRTGSYGQWQTSLNGQYHSGDWQFSVRSSVDNAENDYQYYNRANGQQEYRDHNRMEQENVMASVGYKSGVSKMTSTIWFSKSNNQIPGSILKEASQARQEDRALRWLTSYESKVGRARITLKNYFDRVDLNYLDPEIDTRSLSANRRWMISSSIALPVSDQLLWKGEISGALTGAETNNYVSDKTRQQFSVLTNPEVVLFDRRFRVYPALRLDAYNAFGTVLSPSLGANYALLPDFLYLRGQLSKDFNPPTFNALYWGQGGNPNLEPERSNSTEAGFRMMPGRSGFSSFKLTAFYSQVDNGIRWFPSDNGIYTPSNVEQITIRGVEGALENRYVLPGEFQLEFRQSASLTQSEITEPRFPGDAAVGHQMRYVPEWKYHATLSFKKGITTGLLQYRWTSRRYYTAAEDINSSLDPYQLLNATFQLQKQFFGLNVTVRGGVRNLLDANYEIIQWYAMPQRNYHFSLTAMYQF